MREFIVDDWCSVKILRNFKMDQKNQICQWCLDNIGNGQEVNDVMPFKEDYVWYFQNWYGFFRFHFQNDAHLTWFILRWSQ